MKVNMTPNPLDVVTIHASQGDSEARQWEFELHNNGELIDTSDVKEQLVFKACKGGTEQLLPENTSTPTTSPFKGDIRYPQGLLTDQEFTYRQSPTEEDGLAKITDIKGNTLVWNQLVPIPTRATTTTSGITFTNNNDGSVTASGTASATAIWNHANANAINIVSGHKYLLKGCPSGGGNSTYQLSLRASNGSTIIGNDIGNGILLTVSSNYTNCALYLRVVSGATINGTFKPCLFDLTQMGLDISDPSEFTSLFPLSYYSYNQGSLLSFNGNGLKTVGKNLLKLNIADGTYLGLAVKKEDDGSISINGRTTSSGNIYVMNNTGNDFYVPNNAVLSTNVVSHGEYDVKLTTLENTNIVSIGNESLSANVPKGWYKGLRLYLANGRDYNLNLKLMIAFDSTDYEPYTSSLLNLPISTYFPNGMNGVNDVHDELRNDGTTLRMALLNLGIMNWISEEDNGAGKFRAVPNLVNAMYHGEVILPKYTNNKNGNYLNMQNMEVSITNAQISPMLRIRNESFAGYTVAQVKDAFQNVYMAYELQTPIENFGVVDLGSLEWEVADSSAKIFRCQPTGIKNAVSPTHENRQKGAACSKYIPSQTLSISSSMNDKCWLRDGYYLYVRDISYSNAVAFKQSLQGVYLYYELETPTEASFTTASLVTENAEIPLTNDDGVLIGKCTEQLSENPGFIDAKIKLADADGECYSNKIQLHVERSPQ